MKYNTKLLGKTEAHPNPNTANGIQKIATMAVLLKYLGNFCISLEIQLINCKVELKLKWTKYCVLTAVGNDNTNVNPDNLIFTMKVTILYLPVATLSAKDNQKLLKILSKGFERLVYWKEYKTQKENKNATNEYTYFLKSNFVRVNRLFILVYLNRKNNGKQFNARRCYLPKGILKTYNFVINRKTFMTKQLMLIKNDTKKLEN